jgi:hypothetical protein
VRSSVIKKNQFKRNFCTLVRKRLKDVGDNLIGVKDKNVGYNKKCIVYISKISVNNVGEYIDTNE